MASTQVEVESIKEECADLQRIIIPSDFQWESRLSPKSQISADADAPQSWSQILAPYLESVMTCRGSYTPEEVFQHVNFFTEHVGSWLGPGPAKKSTRSDIIYSPQYPSSMTNDHTPFELSCCWRSRSQQGIPIVRYVVDVVPSSIDGDRSTSLARAIEAIQTLKTVATDSGGPLQLDVFPELWTDITKTFLQLERQIHQTPCSRCAPSSTFIGFDLGHFKLKTKFYWLLPSCQTTPKLLQMLDRVFQSCSAVDPFFTSPTFTNAWHKIRDHVASNPESLCPRMLSVDATQYPAPRIKFYARCVFSDSSAFDAIEPHLTMNGKVDLTPEFMSTCRNLWTSLATSPKEWDSRQQAGPKYCLILYEISTASLSAGEIKSDVSSKLYIMCQEIARRDSVIAQKLLTNCRVVGGAPLLKTFASQTGPTAFITEVGLASRKDDTEVSIYGSPCWFSKRLWEDCEDSDGYFSKIRNPVIKN